MFKCEIERYLRRRKETRKFQVWVVIEIDIRMFSSNELHEIMIKNDGQYLSGRAGGGVSPEAQSLTNEAKMTVLQ